MKFKRIISALTLLLSCLVMTKNAYINGGQNEELQLPTSSIEYRKKDNNDKYKLTENNNRTRSISFSTKLIDYYDGYDLTDEQTNYLLNKTIEYNATCYYEIGLFTFDNIVSDDYGEESDFKFTFYGFTKKINNHNDVLLHFGTATMLASDVIATDEEDPLCFVPIHLPGGIEIIDSIYIEIATVSITLQDEEDAENIALDLIEPPILDSLDNYLHYFFFIFKLIMMESNYNHNNEYELTHGVHTDLIENQNLCVDNVLIYSNYRFGFGANIQENGCGVIAAFNALYEAGSLVSFPALIYYFEYCGADLLFGHFGVNPVSGVILDAASVSLALIYTSILRPFLLLAFETIKPLLFAVVGLSPTEILLPGAGYILVFAAISTLENLIYCANDLISSFLIWYLSYMRSEDEVLKNLFGYNKIYDYPLGYISNFKSDLRTHRQAIICFWNTYSHEDGGIVVMDGVHYIYISSHDFSDHGFATTYLAINNNNVGPYAPNLVSSFFTSGTNYGVDQQFLWGFIIHD